MKLIKMLQQTLRPQKGFTLIELMIVVGIIGILVAIAAPNFAKYQSKARQAEAKISLAAVYTAEKSFYSEYSSYIPSMDAIGYAAEGNKRFYSLGWAAAFTGSVAGYNGTVANENIARTNFPAAFSDCTITLSSDPAAAAVDPQTFNAFAIGQLRDGLTTCDAWAINENKVLTNSAIGL